MLLITPFGLKAEGDLLADISYLKTRIELVNFPALRRVAVDLSSRYPRQYNIKSELAEIEVFEKDYEKHISNFLKFSVQLAAGSTTDHKAELVNAVTYFKELIAFKQEFLLKIPQLNLKKLF